MSENSRMRELLDGQLSYEEIKADPLLMSLAERVYGSDFLEQIGVSRGAAKRALTEEYAQPEEDILLESVPEGLPALPALDLPMPGDMPGAPMLPAAVEVESGRSIMAMLKMGAGGLALGANLLNLTWGLGNILPTCASEVHSTCGASMKLNWLDFFRMNEHIAWSPTLSVGIPDVLFAIAGIALLVQGIRNR